VTGEELSKLILQVLGVLLGGGALQIVVRLLSRRSELRKVSSETDSVVVQAANNQVIRLEEEVARVVRELDTFRNDVARERANRDQQFVEMQRHHTKAILEQQARNNELLDSMRIENDNLQRQVIKLRLELDSANDKIRRLEDGQ
jgi:hypothetical protein